MVLFFVFSSTTKSVVLENTFCWSFHKVDQGNFQLNELLDPQVNFVTVPKLTNITDWIDVYLLQAARILSSTTSVGSPVINLQLTTITNRETAVDKILASKQISKVTKGVYVCLSSDYIKV